VFTLKESCGVVGIYAPGEDVARLTYFALYSLQHRGQESAGIATSDGHMANVHKSMGLVAQVFTEENLHPLKGYIAIGHNRYSTSGSSKLKNAQPYVIETWYGPLGVAHNGNLTNAASLRRDLLQTGVGLRSSSDSEVITQLLAGCKGETWEERIAQFMRRAEGAYSLTILTRKALFAVRDPWGFRPLCYGRLGGGWVIASESCALDTIGAEYVREIEPGEIITVDDYGLRSVQGREPEKRSLCTFEHIYFARPDSLFDGHVIHQVRQALGKEVAREHPVDGDVVVAVPDSAIPAAIGYALESGIPFTEGLIKNRYIGRTFIQPSDRLRRAGVALKFNPLTDNLAGKRIILVDDSVVRGTTSGPLVRLLRQAGASEVHIRVSSPPIRFPCFMGVDMATHRELIASRMTVPEIERYLGCDSLGYLSLDGMMRAIGEASEAYCNACFTGRYPLELGDQLGKEGFEEMAIGVVYGEEEREA
jgi:amidophosphoribosyltransferase